MIPSLRAAYDEPQRRYHTLAHIEDCLARLAAISELSEHDRKLLTLAIWWHDAVYDPTRGDNEALSAELAGHDLSALNVPASDVVEVQRLIMLTKGHEVGDDDRLGRLLVSIDLSILGAEPSVYRAYARAVREEYAHVPEAAYRMGRAHILSSFLKAPRLFPDQAFAALEGPARANLQAEIAELTAE